MIKFFAHRSAFLSILLGINLIGFAHGQQAVPPSAAVEKNDQIRVTVDKIGHADNGTLVLQVEIHAKKSEPLLLIANAKAANLSAPGGIQPFSLRDSYLTDFYTENKISALHTLPDKPFYGPTALSARLSGGQSIQMGIAFPKPPSPPEKEGKPQDYKFMLHVSIVPDPIPITYPADSGEVSPPSQ